MLQSDGDDKGRNKAEEIAEDDSLILPHQATLIFTRGKQPANFVEGSVS